MMMAIVWVVTAGLLHHLFCYSRAYLSLGNGYAEQSPTANNQVRRREEGEAPLPSSFL